jgi:hypothetical protein
MSFIKHPVTKKLMWLPKAAHDAHQEALKAQAEKAQMHAHEAKRAKRPLRKTYAR